jgi:hypothetical protein
LFTIAKHQSIGTSAVDMLEAIEDLSFHGGGPTPEQTVPQPIH